MKLFIIVNKDSFLLSHRREIVIEAVRRGDSVTVVAKDTGRSAEVRALGAEFIDLPIEPTGTNPLQEIKTLRFLCRLFRTHRPDVVHNVGLKTILWGGLACRFTGVKAVVNAVSGLGTMFASEHLSLVPRVIMRAIRYACHREGVKVIFQNDDDRRLFLDHRVITPEQCEFIKGSGVDLETYKYLPEPATEKRNVIFMARMVKEKGVLTLVEAANKLREKYVDSVEFWLCGGLSDNPQALSKEELEQMCDGHYIKWLGHRNDVMQLLGQAHIVAFPSYYREGLPKSLIEANAVGRPIVTTDSVGCRDAVEEGYNGYLIGVNDADALAARLDTLLSDAELRERMGRNARCFAERNFSIVDVVDRHLEIYDSLSLRQVV